MEAKSDERRDEQDGGRLLSALEAAHHLGITPELVYAYTQHECGADARRLSTEQREGRTRFTEAEVDDFDRYLRLPWVAKGVTRTKPPPWIEIHLRAESGNRCLRCGEGRGVETAHIEAWARSRSHHHDNLARICSACHNEHDRHKSLPTEELRRIKNAAVARTRASLARQMGLVDSRFGPPPSETSFVGRAEELEMLCTALEEGSAVLLQGPGGIGKTQLLLKALERRQSGGRVVWLDVEGYGTTEDIVTAFAMSSADLEADDTLERVARVLDAEGACVVLDGVEQLGGVGLDELDDLLADLRKRLRKAQLVVTSQVDLPRTGFDGKLVLSGLDAGSSRRLFRSFVRGDAQVDGVSETQLLGFAEGHPLALRLIAALVEYLGSGRSALREIRREGAAVVEIPKRAKQNRQTSLDKCLSLAYRMLSPEEQRLLYVVASCPGGVFAHQLEHYAGAGAPVLTAALRRWSLVETRDVGVPIDRWYALSPIRSFASRRWRGANKTEAVALRDELLRDFGVMAAVIETQAQDAADVPHMVSRFWLEWPNLMLVVDEAEARAEDTDLAVLASGVRSSMVRFFFVARLPEQGVRVMTRGAQVAMRAGRWKEASGYIAEAAGLAQRSDDDRVAVTVEALSEAMPAERGDAGHLAVARAILANRRGNAHETEKQAQKAILHYEGVRDRLSLEGDGADEEDLAEVRNELSGAYQLLGHALLALRLPREARTAYDEALEMVGGASRAVNEGQILYQIGLCQRRLGAPADGAGYFARAAVCFQGVGMREYLANALGSLGYALLEMDGKGAVPENLSVSVLRHGIHDAVESVVGCVSTEHAPDSEASAWAIRRLFGAVVVVSLSDEASLLGEAGRGLRAWVEVAPFELIRRGKVENVRLSALPYLEVVAEIMCAVVEFEERWEGASGIGAEAADELRQAVAWLGPLGDLESVGVEWLRAYLRRKWSIVEDGSR